MKKFTSLLLAALIAFPMSSFGVIKRPHEEQHLLQKNQMVNPGFENQKFIPEVIPKVKQLREMVEKTGLDIDIEVDGGINSETIGHVSSAGANVFVAGSAIFYTKDYPQTIRLMRERMCA